jgi:hypothetical protein
MIALMALPNVATRQGSIHAPHAPFCVASRLLHRKERMLPWKDERNHEATCGYNVIKSQREEAERRQLMTKAVKAKARLLH